MLFRSTGGSDNPFDPSKRVADGGATIQAFLSIEVSDADPPAALATLGEMESTTVDDGADVGFASRKFFNSVGMLINGRMIRPVLAVDVDAIRGNSLYGGAVGVNRKPQATSRRIKRMVNGPILGPVRRWLEVVDKEGVREESAGAAFHRRIDKVTLPFWRVSE